jgi:flagellar protein FlaF
MGFSTSIAVVILFLGTLLIVTSIYPTLDRSTEMLMEARAAQQERMLDQLNTKITITGITQQGSDLNITVRNDGSTVLDSSELDVLLDGSYVTPGSITPSGVWTPDTSINVILTDVSPLTNRRIKIIAKNGQSDYATS